MLVCLHFKTTYVHKVPYEDIANLLFYMRQLEPKKLHPDMSDTPMHFNTQSAKTP